MAEAKLTHLPHPQRKLLVAVLHHLLLLFDRVPPQLHRQRNVHRRRRLAVALKVVDLVRDVALLRVLVQERQRRLHCTLRGLLLDHDEV